MEQMAIFDNILHKAEWVEALRSGKYKQGRQRLYCGRNNSYCCLGVWAKIAGYEISDASDDIIVGGREVGYDPIYAAFGGNEVTRLFTGLNDHVRSTFGEIADFVEGKGPSIADARLMICKAGRGEGEIDAADS